MRILLFVSLVISTVVKANQNVSDSELKAKIIGVWSASYDKPNYWLYGESLYRPDGTLLNRAKVCVNGKCEMIEMLESYEINNGVLTSKVISTNTPVHPVGQIATDKIKSINNKQMLLMNLQGKVYSRKKVINAKYVK